MGKRWGALVVLVAALLAGCGSGGDGGATAPDDEKAKALKYAQCMRDNGVDMPDPTFGEDGSIRMGTMALGKDDDPTVFTAATEACKEFRSSSRFDPDDPKLKEERLEFAQCMREHGVDVSDPDAQGRTSIDESSVDDKTLDDAMTACGKGGAVPAAPAEGGK